LDDLEDEYAQMNFAGQGAKRAAAAGLNLHLDDYATVLPGGVAMPVSRKTNGCTYFVTPATRSSMSSLHKDSGGNLLFVRVGRKEIVLGPPCAVEPANQQGNGVRHDPFEDAEVFSSPPAPWRMIVVKEGECVFIPDGWYHKVRSVAGTFAVSIELRAVRE
jgi:hypothetical protein